MANRIFYRSGTSYARDVDMDGFISEEDRKILYERWDEGVSKFGWSPVLKFRGDLSSISCEMVLQVPKEELIKIYAVKRSLRLIEAAKKNTQMR